MKYLIKAIRKLRRQEKCQHTHMSKQNLDGIHWYSLRKDRKYKDMGEHGSLQLRCCYICGKVWVIDVGA